MEDESFEGIIGEIKNTISRFQKIEGREWGIEGAVIELTKQVGQLSALIMNREGCYYSEREKEGVAHEATNDNIADELADIMFAVVRISEYYNIDLLQTNLKTRIDEDRFLKSKGV